MEDKDFEQWLRDELELLISKGNLGKYAYCKIDQIVLFSKELTINYFTHIDFSSKYKGKEKFHFIGDGPKIGEYRVCISTYTITVTELIEIYVNAVLSGIWEYDEKPVVLDDCFVTEKKFVPSNDPTGGQYNLFVPLEYALYGSNFSGNYYIYELYSKKTELNAILDDKVINNIQNEIKKCKLNFRLDKLQDRVGNIICKFNIESISATPKKLGQNRGIEYVFSSNDQNMNGTYSLHILQEYDGIIYKNKIQTDYNLEPVYVEPNQYKTTISITNNSTELTLFYACFDYRVLSNYYSQITPPTIVAQSPDQRILHFKDRDSMVELSNVQMLGSVYAFYEMENATSRNERLNDQWFMEKGYLKSYTVNQHEKAITDIVSIINSNLLWDLEELWIIDPYMCADDIIKTAFQCKKKGVVIKALNSYGAIHKNKETKDSMNASDFSSYKDFQSTQLSTVLGRETDLKIEYRTIRDGKGLSFHDRYIILKYNINNDRVWSLGASINSIGKTHSIIQIVESPGTILQLFNDLWIKTNHDNCRIFSNSQ